MPRARLDIFGKDYPGLKPLHYSKEKSADGKLLVTCKCKKCKREKDVRPKHLSVLKSCGECGVREKAALRNLAGVHDAVRAEQTTHEIKVDDDGRWLALRRVLRFYNVSKKMLTFWTSSCEWLNGEALLTRRFTGAFGQDATYYNEKDLNRIQVAQARRKPVPEVPGLIPIKQALAKLGIAHSTLLLWLPEIGETTQLIDGKSKSGRSIKRAYITQTAFDRLSGSNSKGQQTVIAKAPSATTTSNVDRFLEIRGYANRQLKGIQQKIVLHVCDSNGACSLALLAAEFDWQDRNSAFNAAQIKINTKLRTAKLPWILRRQNNSATLIFVEPKVR